MSKSIQTGRPLTLSIVSLIIFFVGLLGTLSAVIICSLLSLRPEISFYFSGSEMFVVVLWFVIGPLLLIAGYYLWKMRRWAAWLAIAIVSFDLVTTPFLDLFIYKIDLYSFLAWATDIAIILLIATVWKHLT